MDHRLINTVVFITLGMGLFGLHSGLNLSPTWLALTLPMAAILGLLWVGAGWLTGMMVRRQESWWPQRAPCLGSSVGLPELGWHLRDLADFLNANWILAALVLGGCTMTLPLAPFCFLAWWIGVCRAGW